MDRLKRATTKDDTTSGCTNLTDPLPGNYDETYTYNSASGNLESKTGLGSYSYSDPAHIHAVTGLDGTPRYAYDANGNMTSRVVGGLTYSMIYDAENHLVEIQQGSTMVARYVYDGDGARVLTKLGNNDITITLGDTFEVFIDADYTPTPPTNTCTNCTHKAYLPVVIDQTEKPATGQVWRTYYYADGQRVAMRVKSNQDGVEDGIFYFLTDHLGSTAITLDTGANKVAELRYSAWGDTRYTDGVTPTQRRYTGQLEAEAGLYFYNARWFDPGLGRFAQSDTIVPLASQGLLAWDRYAFVNNNPVRWKDPSGHCIGPLALVCAGVAIIGVAISIAQINTGVEDVQAALAQPQMIDNEQAAAQQWQENCLGQCHYAYSAPVIPNVVVGGPRPESPVSDQLGMGYFNIAQGAVGLIGSLVGLAKVGTSAFQPRIATSTTTSNPEALANDISDWVSDGGGHASL